MRKILKWNKEVKIKREEYKAIIEGEMVNPPEDKMLMHVRRDVQKYKYIEKVIKWAEETVIRSFIDKITPSQEELFEHILKFTPKYCE